MANTSTIYDLTTKEYLHLGKCGKDFFTEAPDKELVTFMAERLSLGHTLHAYYDSRGTPEGFYDEGEFEKWKEIYVIPQTEEE
jgi:hypothetical protein